MVPFLLFGAGLALVYFGAEHMVAAASRLAVRLGISPLLLGLTIVAFGTSAPELGISLLAALSGSPDLAVGNVVGSNIANVALVAGVAALFAPLVVERLALRRDVPVMILGLLLLTLFARDGTLSTLDGLLLLLYLLAFLGLCLHLARRQRARSTPQEDSPEASGRPWRDAGLFCIALIGLLLGAHLMVLAATTIARELGVSELVIGVTIVAIGTSLPELATSIVAAARKEAALSLGNIVGSNIFNTGFVLGGVALVVPLDIHPQAIRFDIPIMLGVCLLLVPLVARRHTLSRAGGLLLVVLYAAYLIGTYLQSA